ncbi:MAG: hypothetical protein OEV40_13755 [Acidimicrobiia bacterium]|nr:hypothetical protein [Acidimicrobiia bacterium]
MNAGGHIAVVARAGDLGDRAGASGGRLLGSALPDFAAMGRFRLLGRTDNTEVAAGIALHHRTDDLFHRHAWFRTRNRALSRELETAGVGRGPAMACSHVGLELLLDGRLLAEPPIASANTEAIRELEAVADELDELVAIPHRQAWRAHLDRLGAYGLPTDYDDPVAVANRLHRILARRPRLALPAEQVELVARALGRRLEDIDRTAIELLEDLAESLAR